MAINKVVITGNLCGDPELKYLTSGKAISTLTIAVANRFKKDDAAFIECQAWEKTAELICEYLRKGSKVGIVGELQQQRWEKEGKKQSKIIINIEQVEFLDSKKEG